MTGSSRPLKRELCLERVPEKPSLTNHPISRACRIALNTLLALSIACVIYSFAWEVSTRSYLKGFSDAIIAPSDGPEQKVEAILRWMAHGPERNSDVNSSELASRNPEETLNNKQFLEVCGTATNAFVNLAQSSGLRARRLLLLNQNRSSKHVVVEVLIGDRWVIVDPSYHFLARLPNGHLVTRMEMIEPAIFRALTQSIPNYPANYTYESTAHVRLSRIPWIGKYLRGVFNFVWPGWEEAVNWTLLVERESFAALVASTVLFSFTLAMWLILKLYFMRTLPIFIQRPDHTSSVDPSPKFFR